MAVTKSGGHLALTPEVMRKLAPADQLEFAPAYFQGQFMKLVPESSASLFTEADRIGIADAIRRTGAAPTADIDELLAKTGDIYDLDDNLFRQRLGGILKRNNVAGKEGIFAAIEAELSPYKNRILAPEKSDNIGGYINKLMVLGSTMEQQDDILKSLDDAGGVQGTLAEIIRRQSITGLLAPSDAVDVAVQAGSLSIKGLDITNSAAVRDAYIKGTAAALAAINQVADVDQIAVALDSLKIGDLDEAGAHVLTQVGRRMGMQRAAKEALGLDMENLGVDSALFDLKIATNKQAQELILQGMQQGAADLLTDKEGQTFFTDAQKDSIRATSDRFQEKGVAGLREEIVLAGNSKYRSASILINAAETSNAMIASSQRELYKSLNPTEIDAFYFRRQSDIMPRQLEEVGNEIVSEFLNDAGKIDSMVREPGYQATQEAKARESIFKVKMGEKYEALIKEETERLRTEGFTEIDELDVADAIERSQRSMKTRTKQNEYSIRCRDRRRWIYS